MASLSGGRFQSRAGTKAHTSQRETFQLLTKSSYERTEIYPEHVTVILMEKQYILKKIPQCQEMKIYVLFLCCVQIKFYPMTKSTVFLFLLSVALRPELEGITNRCCMKMFGALLFTWAPLERKKNELNYVIFLLIGFTGIFSKPLFIFIGGEGNDMPLKYQPWSAYEGKENILVISLPFQFRYRALAQLFCTQWICYEMLNFFFILVLL